MGKQNKNKLVKVVAPQHVSKSAPLVISFARWTQDSLPMDVTVEIVDVDKGSDDNTKTTDDVVVTFTGTLTPTSGESAQLENIQVTSITSPARSSDRVWVRFANQTNVDVVEAGIPFSPMVPGDKGAKREKDQKDTPAELAANEGSFYELAARVREGHGADGAEIVISDATAVRQRAFLLLAVEPLSQNDSSMTHDVGTRILETYHPTEKGKHQPRNWNDCVIRFRDHLPMMVGKAGCSYVVVTMLLRYLRIDAPSPKPDESEAELAPTDPVANQTIRLWDYHIKFEEVSKNAQYKPRFNTKELNPDFASSLEITNARYEDERNAFVAHFPALGKRKSDKKALLAFFKKKTKHKDGFMVDPPPLGVNLDESDYYVARTITAESYLPLVVWYINQYDGRDDGYAMRHHNLNQHELVLEGASDYRLLDESTYANWVPQYKEIPLVKGTQRLDKFDHMAEGTKGKSAGNDDAILVPLSYNLIREFNLINTAPHKLVNEYADTQPGDPELLPWQRYFVATLERGLPVIGCFSPGQYSSRDKGGHFCMVVGYRYRVDPDNPKKKEIRFIINDPAGGLTFQYEAHDERELNPDGVDPTSVLKSGNKNLGMDRERMGLNLILDRRKMLSIRETYVYEPADGSGASAWDTNRHARFLFYKGKLENDVG